MGKNWTMTYSGKQFFPEHPSPDMIDIETIAHCLSLENRYANHTPKPYSVALHSILTSFLVPKADAMAALMHDASEAYLKDIPSPIKALMPGYKEIESNLEHVIQNMFNIDMTYSKDVVKRADMEMLRWEVENLFPDGDLKDVWKASVGDPEESTRILLRGCEKWAEYCPEEIENMFIERFNHLNGKRHNV